MKMNKITRLWQALERVPGATATQGEWRTLLGPEHDDVWRMFRPNGKTAFSVPCSAHPPCQCHHEVIEHAPDDLVAVCRCGDCVEPSVMLQRSDTVLYEFRRQELVGALTLILSLQPDSSQDAVAPGLFRLGTYSPFAGYRFPVFLAINVAQEDFDGSVAIAISLADGPFILLAPTSDYLNARLEGLLRGRKACFLALNEIAGLDDKGRLVKTVDDPLGEFRKAVIPKSQANSNMEFFPTPADAQWRDVVIQFKDGHTVSVRVKGERGVFNYTQMGMANKKNGSPTVQWELLQTFAERNGQLDWSSSKANSKNQKRSENLASNLREFFRIDGDPIYWDKEAGSWKTRFMLLPEGSD